MSEFRRWKDRPGGELGGLTVAITGGASGIGLATARLMARRGALVACLDVSIGQVGPAAELSYGLPGPLLGVPCDVTDQASADAAITAVVERFDGLDVLVNNAGIGARGTIADNDEAEWARVLDVNVTGIARVTRAALPHLRRSPSAAIVNTCSIAATAGLPDRALYSASKGAVLALTRAMAADHVAEGIRVNCVNPGTVDTPWVGRLVAATDDPDAAREVLRTRQPTGRMVTADEVAHAVAALASPLAASITGTSLAVDGGMDGLRRSPAG